MHAIYAQRACCCSPSFLADRSIGRSRRVFFRLRSRSPIPKLGLQRRQAPIAFSAHDGSAPVDIEPEDFHSEEFIDLSDTFGMASSNTDHGSPQNVATMLLDEQETLTSILDTASTVHAQVAPNTGARIHDFCLGIPYGGLLVVGGTVWYVVTGSLSALQFGFLLGGLSLALSISSFSVWKKGKSSMSHIQGQAAISFVLLLVEAQKAYQKKALLPAIVALMSGAMFIFFSYVFISGGNPPKKRSVAV